MPTLRWGNLAAMNVTARLLLLVALCACGGATTPSAEPHVATSDDSPGAKCLAIADAPRAHKADEPTRITVKHVLVKWSGAKNAPNGLTRTREDACVRALEAHAKLEQGASFTDVVKDYSDDPGAATLEGLVGQIERRDVAPAFADAAFELARGEVSHVVETPSGFHIILRSE
jgi:NIMA-interacting peptidyl-prolyl cis-trans isomerase 1